MDLTDCWLYMDPMGSVIGPYPSKRMREWLREKTIDKTLMIRSAAFETKFQPIEVVFPDISRAFMPEIGNGRVKDPERRVGTLVSFTVAGDDFVDEDLK